MVRLGVETALRALRRLLERRARRTTPAPRETYVDLGRGEFHAGRSLDTLLAAYRVGARVTWRRFVEAGTRGGLEPEALFDIGEAIFAYIDMLSAESAEGYARGARRRRASAGAPPAARAAAGAARRRPRSVRAAAQAAGWELPRELVAALVARPRPSEPEPTPRSADASRRGWRAARPGVVAAARDGLASCLPDPDAPGPPARRSRRRRRRARRARARGAVAGGGGEPAPRARRRLAALDAARLARRGVGARRSVVADEHLAALLLGADPELAAELAAHAARAAGRPRRRPARAARGRRCARGSTAPARSRRSPPSSACTRRPSATASASCASCSATRSRTPTRASSSRSRCARRRRRALL